MAAARRGASGTRPRAPARRSTPRAARSRSRAPWPSATAGPAASVSTPPALGAGGRVGASGEVRRRRACSGDHWQTAAKKVNSSSLAAPVATIRAAASCEHSYRPGIISRRSPTSHREVSTRSRRCLSTSPPIMSGREPNGRKLSSSRRRSRSPIVLFVGRSRSSPIVPSVSGSWSSTSTMPRCRCGCSTKTACGCARSTQPFSGTASSCTHHDSPLASCGSGGDGCVLC